MRYIKVTVSEIYKQGYKCGIQSLLFLKYTNRGFTGGMKKLPVLKYTNRDINLVYNFYSF